MKGHVEIAGVCGDRCEEDGGEFWHGATFPLDGESGEISFAVHDSGTVEVVTELWLDHPGPDTLSALARKLTDAMAEFSAVDPNKARSALKWVAAASEKGVIR